MESRPGDEAARDFLLHRGDYHLAVGGWLAQALADHSGHYADLAARTAAIDSLPAAVRADAALLAALAHVSDPGTRQATGRELLDAIEERGWVGGRTRRVLGRCDIERQGT
jgi:hypothetical protein